MRNKVSEFILAYSAVGFPMDLLFSLPLKAISIPLRYAQNPLIPITTHKLEICYLDDDKK